MINKNEMTSMAIVLPDSANSIVLFSAEELKKHLKLLFEEDIVITSVSKKNQYKKHFFIGIKPTNFKEKLITQKMIFMGSSNSFDMHFILCVSREQNGKLPIYTRIIVNKTKCELAL